MYFYVYERFYRLDTGVKRNVSMVHHRKSRIFKTALHSEYVKRRKDVMIVRLLHIFPANCSCVADHLYITANTTSHARSFTEIGTLRMGREFLLI